jgi:RNA-directed DNA polymerase
VESKTRIIDIDLRAYFDNVQHYLLLEKVARRVQDDEVMHLLKMMLKATGEKGVPQVLSRLLCRRRFRIAAMPPLNPSI